MKARLTDFGSRLQRLSPRTLLAVAIAYTLVLVVLDSIAPRHMSFTLLYLLAIALVGWRAGFWPALVFSAISATGRGLSDWIEAERGAAYWWVTGWNVATRFLLCGAFGWLTAMASRLTRSLAGLVEERTAQFNSEVEQRKATATRLEEALQRFQQLTDNISEVFWLKEATSKEMVYVSPGYERIWGRRCEELYRKPDSWLAAVHPEDREAVERRVTTEPAAGRYDVEYRILRPDGAVCWIHDRAFPVSNPQGEVYRIAGVAEDITEQKRAEQVREAFVSLGAGLSAARSRVDVARAINAAADLLWKWDASVLDLFLPGSDQFETVLACDIVDGQRREVLAAHLSGPPTAMMQRLLSQGAQLVLVQPGDTSDRGFLPFGDVSQRSASMMYVLVRAESGMVGLLSIQSYTPNAYTQSDLQTLQALANYTAGAIERLRAEEALRQREEQTRSILGAAMDGYYAADFAADPGGAIIEVNDAYCRLTGFSREELLRMRLADLEAEESPEEVARHMQKIVANRGDRFETRHHRKHEEPVQVEISVSALPGRERRTFGFVRDISERKRAEAKLRESEQRLRVFLNAVPEPALLLDREGIVLACNSASGLRLGRPEKRLIGQCIFDLLPPENRATRKAILDQVVRSREARQFEDERSGRHYMHFVNPVFDEEGTVTCVAILALDITERTRAQRALAKQEALYRTLYELSPDGIMLEDMDGKIVDVNQGLCQMLGYSRAELVEQDVRFLVPVERRGEVEAHLAALRAGERLDHKVWNLRKNGERCQVRLNERLLTLPDGQSLILVVAHDITRSEREGRLKEAFLSLAAELTRVQTPAAAARAIYARADELWHWDAAALDLLRPESGQVETVLALDVVEGRRQEVACMEPAGEPTAKFVRVLTQGAELSLRRPEEPPPTDTVRFGDASRPSASVMSVPLRAEGRAIGVLSIQSYMFNAYSREDLDALQALVDQCSGAMERIRAEEALRESYRMLEQRVQERTEELRLANEALAANEARLRMVLEGANAGSWFWEAATDKWVWDAAYCDLYGIQSAEPASFETWLRRVHPEDRGYLLERARLLTEPSTGNAWQEEFRLLHPIKGELWLLRLGRVERDAAGRAVRVHGISLDITERKGAEESQRAQRAYIEAIYRSTPVGLCVLDTDFRYVRINERLAAVNGKPVEQHVGRTVREMVPHLAEGTEAICRQVIATGQPVLNLEMSGTTAAQPGVPRVWNSHWVPLKEAGGRVGGISVVVEEITERKRMDAALRESEEKYRRLHETMTDAYVRVDMAGRIVECNRAYQEILGYTEAELRQMTAADLTPDKWRAFEARILQEQVLVRGYSDVYEKEYRRKDGMVLPVELRTLLLRDAGGQPSGRWAIVRDISRRKRDERALREARDRLEERVRERTAELQATNAALSESEERYRSLVNNLNVGVFRTRPAAQGGFIQANPALARIHGYDSVQEFLKIKVTDLYQDPKGREIFLADLQRQGMLRNYEVRLKKRDNTPLYGSITATAHRGPDGGVDWIDGVLEDITDRKEAELLHQAQRDLGVKLGSTTEIAEAMNHLLDAVVGVGGLDSGGAYLLNEASGGMDMIAHRGASPAYIKAVSRWGPYSPQMVMIAGNQPVFDLYLNLPFRHDAIRKREGLRAVAIIPLVHEGRPIGALGLASRRLDEIPHWAKLLIESVATQATGAIARIRAESERRHLERQILEISNRERTRIGHDLHDGLGQYLTGVALKTKRLEEALEAAGSSEARAARELVALLNEANHQARALARGLDPVHVEAKGIVAALQGLALQSQDLYGIECVFSCAHEHLALKAEPGLALYRIAQEAVRNAAVHGQAQRIQIELALEKAKLRLSIRDDGKGFGRVPKLQSGLGMRTMRYRAEAVGGTLQVESSPAEGTRVCCLLPVEHCLKR